jgi:hypothetical protein
VLNACSLPEADARIDLGRTDSARDRFEINCGRAEYGIAEEFSMKQKQEPSARDEMTGDVTSYRLHRPASIDHIDDLPRRFA